ncbi:ATP-binding cassette domain-containing protein [Algibacillus agarilyticus]|uniref:ATP-binding cassette domain-containing protein n=1 Tax=Algibacillus agarilyticus TaxID=2234133 RepID=UPI000DD01461|nr:ATP-binding cassette domain-containing protein [Algibacillus agarilyticus]
MNTSADLNTIAIFSPNGGGKQMFSQRLIDQHQQQNKKIGLVSFESQQQTYEHELKIDLSDITNEVDPGTLAKDFLPADQLGHPLIKSMHLTHKLNTGYRSLSSGESRKLLLLKAIFSGCEAIICDNPFDSLDSDSCLALSVALEQVHNSGVHVILMLSNLIDLPTWIPQLAWLNKQQLALVGANNSNNVRIIHNNFAALVKQQGEWPQNHKRLADYPHSEMAKLVNCQVIYNDKAIFSSQNLSIKPLQHTLITGANGSGKSTLLQLITGDCPQCFSNQVTVLGYRRGSGETIWDIKKHIGLVSADLHRSYRVNCNVLTVVISGLFDSIGVYKPVENNHISLAKQWLNKVGLVDKSQTLFNQLSYGEQRLVLIARALIKVPLMLVLDEPTLGLDESNRHRILQFLQSIEQQAYSTILMVSHRQDEHLALFKQKIQLA